MTGEFEVEQTDRLLATTRSVRRRLDLTRPVPRDVVVECLRLAVQAPTASNGQRWRWVVVDDPATRRALGEIYRRMGERYLRGYDVPEASTQTERVLASANYLADVMTEVPMLVVPCITGRLESTAPALAASFYGSIVPAIWSFQLALRSRQLGSCFTTLHLAHEAEARRPARHPRGRHAGGTPSGGLHHRWRLLACRASARRGHHVLESLAGLKPAGSTSSTVPRRPNVDR